MKVEGEAASGNGNFNGRVDGRTGSKGNAEGSDQALWGEATGDGDNEWIPQSIGGNDNVESGDNERNVHGDWISDCAKSCSDTDSQWMDVGQLARAGDCGDHRNGRGRGRGGHDERCTSKGCGSQ